MRCLLGVHWAHDEAHNWAAMQVALAACMGEYCGAAAEDDGARMLLETALNAPLPATSPLATVHAVVLPVLCRAHAQRLQQLGLVDDAIAAAERMCRHKEFPVKVRPSPVTARLAADVFDSSPPPQTCCLVRVLAETRCLCRLALLMTRLSVLGWPSASQQVVTGRADRL